MQKHDKKTLQEAAEWLKTLDAQEICADFAKFEHACAPGTYCAFVIDPKNHSIREVNEPSRCCSTDEYFGESGILSSTTILSGTREHWSPGPDDGFEWDYDGTDYYHPKDNPNGWITSDQAVDKAWEILQKLNIPGVEIADAFKFLEGQGWQSFGISDTPVNGWTGSDSEIDRVNCDLAEWISRIEQEIEAIA